MMNPAAVLSSLIWTLTCSHGSDLSAGEGVTVAADEHVLWATGYQTWHFSHHPVRWSPGVQKRILGLMHHSLPRLFRHQFPQAGVTRLCTSGALEDGPMGVLMWPVWWSAGMDPPNQHCWAGLVFQTPRDVLWCHLPASAPQARGPLAAMHIHVWGVWGGAYSSGSCLISIT